MFLKLKAHLPSNASFCYWKHVILHYITSIKSWIFLVSWISLTPSYISESNQDLNNKSEILLKKFIKIRNMFFFYKVIYYINYYNTVYNTIQNNGNET